MDLLHHDIRKLYLQYLFASLGGAIVMTIYSFVDTIAGEEADPVENAAHWDLSAYEHAPVMAALARPKTDNRQRYERKAHYFDITTWRN